MSPSIRTPQSPEPPSGSQARSAQPRSPETGPFPEADLAVLRLEQKLSTLATAVNSWQRELAGATNRSARLEGAFTLLVSSLEGWKTDIRDVSHRTESRVLRGLEAIDSRLAKSTVEQTGPGPELAAAVRGLLEAAERLREAPRELERKQDERFEALESRLSKGLEHLQQDLSSREKPALDLSEPVMSALTRLEQKLGSLEASRPAVQRPEDLQAPVVDALTRLEQRLGSLEANRPAVQRPEDLQAPVVDALTRLEQRLGSLEARMPSAPVPAELQAPVIGALESVEQRLQAIDEKVAGPALAQLRSTLTDALVHLDRRLQTIESAATRTPDPDPALQLSGEISTLQSQLSRGMEVLESRLNQDRREREEKGVEERRQLLQMLTDNLKTLDRRLESVQTGNDENNATQLRYLAGLEELQRTIAKQVRGLEGKLSNPLDVQQWERLAKGLEFLDTKLARSYDSVANRIDTSVAALTATLDNRAASGQEANLKSAERLWMALRGLEDQISTSNQAAHQGQERLDGATTRLANSVEELRAVAGSRAGHTEKLLMEGLESLDERFTQNLLAVSENLGSAIFALSKAVESAKAAVLNTSDQSREEVISEIEAAQAKLAGSLKAGLDSLGRREERMLALILGGGAPVQLPEGSSED